MNTLVIVIEKIPWVIKWWYRSPHFCWLLHRKSWHVLKTLAISFQHVSFWCSFLDSHPIIHHPNIRDTCVNMMPFLIKHLCLIGVWFSEDQWTNTKRHMCQRDWTISLDQLSTSHSNELYSLYSSKMTSHFREVLNKNFNWLFLKLNQLICN